MDPSLHTRYLGLELTSPLVAGASPLTGNLDNLVKLEEAGVGAVVLPSLFEEQIREGGLTDEGMGDEANPAPALAPYNGGPWDYLNLIKQAKQRLSIPVIASVNATSHESWPPHARLLQESGADALEVNIYLTVNDPKQSAEAVERRYAAIVRELRETVKIPVAVKVCPYFTSFAHVADRLVRAGADGLVLFNRYLEPDIDLDVLQVVPRLELSRPSEVRVPLRWIGTLRDRGSCYLAGISGVKSLDEVLKLILVGADVVQITGALLDEGPGLIGRLLEELRGWLTQRDKGLTQIRGFLSRERCLDPTAYERLNYIRSVASFDPQAGEEEQS
jgi:dihydroorotate dehydrogenase (fumarate)